MKNIKLYISLLYALLIVLLSSCISSEETNYMQHIPQKYEIADFKEYKLAVRDNISCRISVTPRGGADADSNDLGDLFSGVVIDDNNRFSGLGLIIYEDSTVIIPFFETVKIAGLTLQEAELKIQDSLKESLTDAQVKLTLLSNYFYIYANDRQGAYRVYKENMTIYQALAISGQTTDRMDLSKVTIVRKGENGLDIRKVFDLRSQDVIQSEFYYIQPNDVIYFSTSKKSFFNITSIQTFISLVMQPLAYLFIIARY